MRPEREGRRTDGTARGWPLSRRPLRGMPVGSDLDAARLADMTRNGSSWIRRQLQSQRSLKPRTRSFFLFVVLPAWLAPGLLDWWCHRRTHVEEPANGGTTESLIHSAMFAEAGVPLLLASAFEMNPLLVTLMAGAAIGHEATAMLDVRVALSSDRHVSQGEQHIHSFLEVMPFWIVPLMMLLNGPMTNRWSLSPRASVLSKRDLAIVAGGVAVAGVLPYAEELLRCLRQARQLRNSPEDAETDSMNISHLTSASASA